MKERTETMKTSYLPRPWSPHVPVHKRLLLRIRKLFSGLSITLGCFAKILPADQLKNELIKCHLCLVVGPCKSNKLAIEVHRVVACFPVVDDFLVVHTRPSFHHADGLIIRIA